MEFTFFCTEKIISYFYGIYVIYYFNFSRIIGSNFFKRNNLISLNKIFRKLVVFL